MIQTPPPSTTMPLSGDIACHRPSVATAGEGQIELRRIGAHTRVVRSIAHQPLKLLTPQSNGHAASVYATTFGGGLVAGDQIHIDLIAGPGTTCFLTTQSATKVYRAVDRRGCRQSLTATLDAAALLVVWPDPLICFSGADYRQDQRFDLQDGAGLALVDWQSSGRRARGERWDFARYQSRNQVRLDGQLVLNDVLLLDSADGPSDAPFRAGRFECIATVVLIGAAITAEIDSIAKAAQTYPIEPCAATLVSASRIARGVIIRILGQDVEQVGRLLQSLLAPITLRLGEDPWSRKW